MAWSETVGFAGVTLNRGLFSLRYGYESVDVCGARAHVETAGDIDRRVTATRLLLTGPLAFGLRKKKDHREVFLTIEGDGFAWAIQVKPQQLGDAHRFAALVNDASSKASLEKSRPPLTRTFEPSERTNEAGGEGKYVEMSERLKELNARLLDGSITTTEFTQRRAELSDPARGSE